MSDVQFNTMTLLNYTGDVTIAWTKDKDSSIREFIEKKMKSGHVFFLIEQPGFIRRMFGAKGKKVELKDLKQLNNRNLVLDDDDAKALLDNKQVTVISPDKTTDTSNEVVSIRRARNADDVLQSGGTHTAVLRPLRGG